MKIVVSGLTVGTFQMENKQKHHGVLARELFLPANDNNYRRRLAIFEMTIISTVYSAYLLAYKYVYTR